MSTGALVYPPGFQFTDDNGTPLNAGKLYAFRTGTATPQSLYSDSTLDTAHSHPIVLNSAGRVTSPVYGDPTVFDYRLTLTTSADVQVFQLDDLVVDGADTATFQSGSFTGTLTGMAGATTGTVTYKIFANAAGTGKLCVLSIGSSITGTSNTTAMTMTGIPAAVSPTATIYVPCLTYDNGASSLGSATIAAAATTITFETDAALSATGFTNSGSKGLIGGWSITYPL